MLLLTLALVLTILGILLVFNTSTYAGKLYYNDSDVFLVKQAIYAAVGIGLMIALVFFPYQKIQAYTVPLVFFTIFLLLLVLIPGIGKKVNNARRWLAVGPLQFQPSELAKLAVLVYMSMIMAKKKEQGLTRSLQGFFPPLLILFAFFMLVVVEPDFSTAVIILFTGLMLFFAGGVPLGHLLGLFLSGLPFIVVMVFSKDYMRSRLFAHIDPLADISKKGYHVVQSLLAFQKGGVGGVGIGNGQQKMGILPESHTDFILAAMSEEIGLLGIGLILLLIMTLITRIFRVAFYAADDFARFFAYGTAVLIGWQALVNVGVVSGLLPATGLPFPFISAGGSSLVVFCVATGIVLNISRNLEQKGALT